ncbi:MAG TPA: Tim44 domain-containing protein, partial [Erythrobacter sp.]|nr:Tim44 domain-containing protein [Erythrobacter sp.]
MLEIVLLAMVAAFLGLRLYSVLGRRAEHEEESIPQRFEGGDNAPAAPPAANAPQLAAAPRAPELAGVMPAVERGIREIAAVDGKFELAS